MYNIIICDDDRAFVDYIKGVMAKSGMDKGEILFSEYYSGEELVQGIRNRKRCDLLILDDLGSELTTPFVQSALYELVNSRLSTRRHTVISSNLTMEAAAKRYSPAIVSRLEGEYHVLHFFGEDIRLLRKARL